MNSDQCPIPGCSEKRRHGQLMCLTHWRRVPRAVQDNVYFTYRAYCDAPIRPAAVFARVNRDRIDAAALAIKAAGEERP